MMIKTSKLVLPLVLVCALIGPAPVRAADKKSSKADPQSEREDLFAQPAVLRVKIEIPESAQQSLRKEPKTYVKATVQEGGKTYADVGVRLKGSGSFLGLDDKPSLALKFNEFVPGQQFHGDTKLLFNNSKQDPSYLCEALGGEVFRAANVPAARVTYARVELNGRQAGLYVVSEAANKDFLSQYFRKAKGNLYEGSNNDITDKLEKDSGDESKDQADLQTLARAVKEADPAQRLKKLSPLLDVDRFITFAAIEVLTWHHEGYCIDRNNYRVYHDPGSSQMVFIPHGLDQLYDKADGALHPEWKGLVAKAVLDTPEGRQKLRDKLGKLLAETAKADTLISRSKELAALIRPALEVPQGKSFESALARLQERITQRAAFLEQQIKSSAPAPK